MYKFVLTDWYDRLRKAVFIACHAGLQIGTVKSPSSFLSCTLGMRSITHSQQPPDWPALSHVDCLTQWEFVELEVV